MAVLVAERHAVEEEGVDVVVERLVVEEQLAQQTEIPAPGALPAAVNLEEADVLVAVDFVARRVHERALCPVAVELALAAKVQQAHFAYVHEVAVAVLDGVGGKVPRLDLVHPHLDLLEVAHAADFGLVLRHGAARPQLFDFFFARVEVLGYGFCGGVGVLHFQQVDCVVFGLIVGLGGSIYGFCGYDCYRG